MIDLELKDFSANLTLVLSAELPNVVEPLIEMTWMRETVARG